MEVDARYLKIPTSPRVMGCRASVPVFVDCILAVFYHRAVVVNSDWLCLNWVKKRPFLRGSDFDGLQAAFAVQSEDKKFGILLPVTSRSQMGLNCTVSCEPLLAVTNFRFFPLMKQANNCHGMP